MNNKKEIRNRILKIRKSLSEKEVKKHSEIICCNVQALENYKKARDICLYMPINNEVDVTYLIESAWADRKQVWLPKVIGGKMDFYAYEKDMKLVKGAFNIPEPDSQQILTPDEATLVIMPGSVFSEVRDRIGYGGGYYDVFLEKYPMCQTIAVCYEFQILPEIPAERHDIKPDAIISQERILL